MASDFPPRKDADLLAMVTDASAKITATPTAYGLTATQATALATLVTSYTSALAASTNPVTRTRPTIAAKNAAKQSLAANLRDLNRYVQANKTITDAKKLEIKFPVYASRTPIPAPGDPPVIMKVLTVGRVSKVTLRGTEEDRRGRPTGVQGALILSFSGEVPPADLGLWKTEGLTTRTEFEVVWSPTIPVASQVWVCAAWYSPRGQAGPACNPISVAIGGGLSVAPGTSGATMKEAA